ncbi:sensor histidine kinase [Antribacter gilvus]|uniref:sensor histidine kinase n=1 Tax=Antribacter gilvus TaxID=2304675 RepID=UPI001F0BD747|nr:histidine kinase [Antribacter gilvus]
MPTPPPVHTTRAARVWGEVWRVLVALVFGFALLIAVTWQVDIGERSMRSIGIVVLDLLFGLVSLCLLPLRRRAPRTIAMVLTLFTAFSTTAVGAAGIAYISLSTRRRWPEMVSVGLIAVGAQAVWSWFYPYPPNTPDGLVDLVAVMVVSALWAWIGAYIGLRREHIRSLRERAETAEREQASRVAQARSTERARIAREMHDVLAHRMSIVAMHAGALAYRTDLPPERVAETATVIQEAAHSALQELRDVLGVLRDLDGVPAPAGDGHTLPEPPQPTLADLDDLLQETRSAGTTVTAHDSLDQPGRLPVAVSRNAYRILQEALTNARKHAPWTPVTISLAGGPGEGLTLTVRNPLPARAPASPPPSSGLGLVGLTERAALSGGRLTHGPVSSQFILEAWLPWSL